MSGQLNSPTALSLERKKKLLIEYSQCRCGRLVEERNLLLLPGIEQQLVGCPIRSLVAIPTTLLAVLYILQEVSQLSYERRSTVILFFHIHFLYLVLDRQLQKDIIKMSFCN